MAEIFHQWRQYYPLSSPINRGGFHYLRMKKKGPKSVKNQSSPLVFFSFISCLSLHHDLRHTTSALPWTGATWPSSPTYPTIVNNNITILPHSLSLLKTSFFFFLPPSQVPNTTNEATVLSINTTTDPHHLRWSSIPALHQPSPPPSSLHARHEIIHVLQLLVVAN